ncbi:universal stress protein [Bradyrhizobium sp. RDI18]|uniref:universal stress protein n=1 Tax=Bradyrhizobium sp. RDI18 TaxID=3367400 RepID=UPI00371F7C8B
MIIMLYAIEPSELQNWAGVRQMQIEEETTKAKALFRLFRRKLAHAGFEAVETEDVIREGRTAEEVNKLIAEDEDIAILVLGASIDAPEPLGRHPLAAQAVRWRICGSRNGRAGPTFTRGNQGISLNWPQNPRRAITSTRPFGVPILEAFQSPDGGRCSFGIGHEVRPACLFRPKPRQTRQR